MPIAECAYTRPDSLVWSAEKPRNDEGSLVKEESKLSTKNFTRLYSTRRYFLVIHRYVDGGNLPEDVKKLLEFGVASEKRLLAHKLS